MQQQVYWQIISKAKRKEQLAASEFFPERSPLDKALVEIVEKMMKQKRLAKN